MLGGLVVSHLLIVIMTLFLNISEFLKHLIIYNFKFSIAYWSAWDDNFVFNTQEKNNVEHTTMFMVKEYGPHYILGK